MFTSSDSRKRKQQDDKFSSSVPITSSWSDFIYSSPSSPSVDNSHGDTSNLMSNINDSLFNLDSFLDLHHINDNSCHSRRHSVAVGEMNYHSFEFLKDDMVSSMDTTNINQLTWTDDIRLLMNNAPVDRPIHKRTQSLRDNDLNCPTSPTHTNVSMDSPNFFSSSFLDALVTDQKNLQSQLEMDPMDEPLMLDLPMIDTQTDTHHLHSADFFKLSSEEYPSLMPSAITHEINSMADWLLEQQDVGINSQQPKRQRCRINSSTSSLSPMSTHTITSLSSLSPSPPITPMQQTSLGFEPIPYTQQTVVKAESEEWDSNIPLVNTINKGEMISARIIQGQSTASLLQPMIQDYLLRRDHHDRSLPVMGERTVMVLTSKVAQKSYGTEKRFLCPPPTTLLKGASWWTNTTSAKPNMTEPKKSLHFFHSQNNTLTSPKLTIHISGENINQSGVVEWQSSNGAIIDTSNLTSNLSPAISQHHSSVTGRCVSKQLFINDADEKRKRVEVLAKIQLGNGIQLGTFPSKGIKVISKPSKKRQSVKNMELCIHHGTTISLFNRIRSQTVSTKYLGVSKGSIPIPNDKSGNHSNNTTNGTCFVARTGSWDPFVIWVVDTSRSPDITNIPKPSQHHPSNPHFPPPPAIALQASSTSQQPIAIHYNQPVVLQCVSTGLVSPVMIIRKVDKASMVLGGNRMDDLSGKTGGECGDETLGDPVSQLHKIAFQIVQDPSFSHHNKARFTNNPLRLSPYPSVNDSNTNWRIPQSCHPVTYLACLNDVVGMHKTTATRNLISQCLPRSSNSSKTENDTLNTAQISPPILPSNWTDLMQGTIENNQVMDSNHDSTNTQNKPTNRRMSTINETKNMTRRASVADRRVGSTVDSSGLEGACWTEDVSDAAVWTIVGTDCATYTFWTPADVPESGCFNMPFDANNNPCSAITPFPTISQTVSSSDLKNHKKSPTSPVLTILGENLTRDLSVWFGDIKSTKSEYKSRDTIVCTIPDPHDLLTSPTLHSDNDGGKRRIPLLLVRGDGVVYRTDQHYTF